MVCLFPPIPEYRQIFITQDGKVTICDGALVNSYDSCAASGGEKTEKLNLKIETANVDGVTQIVAKRGDNTVFGTINNISTEFGNGNAFNITFGSKYVYAVNQTKLPVGFLDGSWLNVIKKGAIILGDKLNGKTPLFYNRVGGGNISVDGFVGQLNRYDGPDRQGSRDWRDTQENLLPISSTLMVVEAIEIKPNPNFDPTKPDDIFNPGHYHASYFDMAYKK